MCSCICSCIRINVKQVSEVRKMYVHDDNLKNNEYSPPLLSSRQQGKEYSFFQLCSQSMKQKSHYICLEDKKKL